MIIDHTTLIFFDASCLIAAAGSPTGGSGFLLALCTRKLLRVAVSQTVLLEVERNIQAKLGQQALRMYHRQLLQAPLSVVPVPQTTHRQPWHGVINQKDEHVLAATLTCKAPFLLTLDRQLIAQVDQANLHLPGLTPGEFIKTVLIHHVEFPSLRT